MQRAKSGKDAGRSFVAGLAVANLPSRQVVPRGAVKAGMPGAFLWEIIFAADKASLQGQKEKSGLAWPLVVGAPARQKSGKPPLSNKIET
jgi:hypothetical protein